LRAAWESSILNHGGFKPVAGIISAATNPSSQLRTLLQVLAIDTFERNHDVLMNQPLPL
jgi:hypothetical protein